MLLFSLLLLDIERYLNMNDMEITTIISGVLGAIGEPEELRERITTWEDR